MPDLLAHALAAMAFQSIFSVIFDCPLISIGIFIAGFVAIIIDLDYIDNIHGKRTPFAHSTFFAFVWNYTTLSLSYIGYKYGVVSYEGMLETTLGVSSAYITHLGLDTLTKEGIYSFPNTRKIRDWFMPSGKNGFNIWTAWRQVPSEIKRLRSRSNTDSILNILVSVSALILLIILLILM